MLNNINNQLLIESENEDVFTIENNKIYAKNFGNCNINIKKKINNNNIICKINAYSIQCSAHNYRNTILQIPTQKSLGAFGAQCLNCKYVSNRYDMYYPEFKIDSYDIYANSQVSFQVYIDHINNNIINNESQFITYQKWRAYNLPNGLTIDENTGIISGIINYETTSFDIDKITTYNNINIIYENNIFDNIQGSIKINLYNVPDIKYKNMSTSSINWQLLQTLQKSNKLKDLLNIGDYVLDYYTDVNTGITFEQQWILVSYKKIQTQDGQQHNAAIFQANKLFDGIAFKTNSSYWVANSGLYVNSDIRVYINNNLISGFSTSLKNALNNVLVPGNYTIYDKLWLPSCTELNYSRSYVNYYTYRYSYSDPAIEGTVYEYYSQGNTRAKEVLNPSSSNASTSYWTRSTFAGYSQSCVWNISNSNEFCGDCSWSNGANGRFGIAPCFAIF